MPAQTNSIDVAWSNTNSIYREVIRMRTASNRDILGFDASEVYKTTVGMYGPTERADFAQILPALKIGTAKMNVLDLGSGTGQLVLPLAMLHPQLTSICGIEYEQTLCDESLEALALAVNRGLVRAGQVQVQQGDFFDPKFSNIISSADRIFYYLSSSDYEHKLEELLGRHVTKPNCKIVAYGDNANPFPRLHRDYGFDVHHDPSSLLSTYTRPAS